MRSAYVSVLVLLYAVTTQQRELVCMMRVRDHNELVLNHITIDSLQPPPPPPPPHHSGHMRKCTRASRNYLKKPLRDPY